MYLRLSKRFGLALILALIGANAQAADRIVFTTPPTQSAEATVQQYQPIAQFLSRATGKTVEIVAARNFLDYSIRMRADEFDLIFDGPHFIGWRMEHMDHEVLAKLPSQLRFVLVTREDDAATSAADLVGRRVCAQAPPNLATMSFMAQHTNPVRQPIIVTVESFPQAMQCLREGRGEAAMLRDQFWARQDQAGFKVVFQTEQQLPDRGFSVSRRIDADTRAKLREALIAMSGDQVVAKAMASIGGAGSQGFVAATDAEYRGLGSLLRDVWGFEE